MVIQLFTVNYRDPRPIYEQIMDYFRKLIISGALSPEEKLPSVREMAASLAINPNTIQRAYRELEQEGYIYSVPGKGNFVGTQNEIESSRKRELMRILSEAVKELKYLGMNTEQIIDCISEGGNDND